MSETMKKLARIAPFDNDSLPEFALKKCVVELKETPENKQNGLRELRNRIQDDKDICSIDFHEDFLIQYLRRHKYNVKGAFKQIQNYVAFRRNYSDLFQSIPVEYFVKDGSRNILKVLPFRCPDGCSVLLVKLSEWDPQCMPIDDLKRMGIMMDMQLFRDPMTQINGVKAIYDFKGTSLQHLRYATPSNMYLFYNFVIKCFPGRYKAAHLVNESPLMKIVWRIIKPLLPEKIVTRVHFHSHVEELENYFPRFMLPTEYGGQLMVKDTGNWLRIANKEHENCSLKGQQNYY